MLIPMGDALIDYSGKLFVPRAGFLTPLDVRAWGKDRWVLLDWFGYRTMIRGYPIEIWAPPGYVSDLASIPAPAQVFLPSDGPYRAAAVPHDWLFDTQDHHDFSFWEVNEVMNEAMQCDAPQFYIRKVPMWQRIPIKAAIDVGAGFAWRNNLSHRFRNDGLRNPEPGGPRGDFASKEHSHSGLNETDAGMAGRTDR